MEEVFRALEACVWPEVAAGKKPDVSAWPQVRVSAREEGSGWQCQGQGGHTCAAVVSSTFQGVETGVRNHLCPHARLWAPPPSSLSRGGELRSGRKAQRGTMWERGTKGPVVDDTHARQLLRLVRDKGQSAISSSPWEQGKAAFFPQACGWLTRRWATCACAGRTQHRLWALFPQPTRRLSPGWPSHMRESSRLPRQV